MLERHLERFNSYQENIDYDKMLSDDLAFYYYFAKAANAISGKDEYSDFIQIVKNNKFQVYATKEPTDEEIKYLSLLAHVSINLKDFFENKEDTYEYVNKYYMDLFKYKDNDNKFVTDFIALKLKTLEKHPMIKILKILCQQKVIDQRWIEDNWQLSICDKQKEIFLYSNELFSLVDIDVIWEEIEEDKLDAKLKSIQDFYNENPIIERPYGDNIVESYKSQQETILNGRCSFLSDKKIFQILNVKELKTLLPIIKLKDKIKVGVMVGAEEWGYSQMARITADIPTLTLEIYKLNKKKN